MIQDIVAKVKEKFPNLTDNKLQSILAMGEIVDLKIGDTFIKKGEQHTKFAVVLKGMLRNYIYNEKGDEITVVFAIEGQVIAPYRCILLNEPASETTEAIEPTILIVFEYMAFSRLAKSDPDLSELQMFYLEQMLVNAIERVEDFASSKPEKRYLRMMDKQRYLVERVPLKYLASYLGVNQVSLSRIRKRIKQGK